MKKQYKDLRKRICKLRKYEAEKQVQKFLHYLEKQRKGVKMVRE
jgi:hypothetical protein